MPTYVATKHGLKLTVKEAELQCSLPLSENPESLAEQRFIALKLAEIYEIGRDDTNKNPWKAKKYLAQATDSVPVQYGFWSAETAFTILGLYTTIRNGLTRANRLLSLEFIGKAFLTRMFSIAGLSFFLELALDLSLVTYQAYQAMPVLTEPLSFFERIKNRWNAFWQCVSNAMKEDPNRTNRMINAAIWGPINLAFFLIASPYAVTVTVLAFGVDLANEVLRQAGIIAPYDGLIEKITAKLTEREQQQGDLKNQLESLMRSQHRLETQIQRCKNLNITISLEHAKNLELQLADIKSQIKHQAEHLTRCKTELGKLRHEIQILNKSKSEANRQRFTALACVGIVLAGVILYSIPGLNIGLVALGVSAVLAVSIYGLSRKLWALGNRFYAYCKNNTHDQSATHDESTKKTPSSLTLTHDKGSSTYSINKLSSSTTSLSSGSQNHANDAIHYAGNGLEQMKVCAQNKINFLKKCRRISTEAKSVSEALACFSTIDIKKIKLIFNLNKDEDWNTQLEYWINHAHASADDKPSTHIPKKNNLFYQCSLGQSIATRLTEERDFRRMLDSPRTSRLKDSSLFQSTESITALEREDHQHMALTP